MPKEHPKVHKEYRKREIQLFNLPIFATKQDR